MFPETPLCDVTVVGDAAGGDLKYSLVVFTLRWDKGDEKTKININL